MNAGARDESVDRQPRASVGQQLRLRDGAELRVRPVEATDAAELQHAFAMLSDLSRYRRFLVGTPRLGDRMALFLADVDHHDHEALVAVETASGAGGTPGIVGVARFVRYQPGGAEADLAITVAEAWQGRGLGTALLDELNRRARQVGVRRFTVDMLADNPAVLGLVRSAGGVTTGGRAGGMVSGHINVPAEVVDLSCQELLSVAARQIAVAVPRPLAELVPELRPTVRAVVDTF